jgi:hypothetical protein
MDLEVLRANLIRGVDKILETRVARMFMITEDIRLLKALRSFTQTAPNDVLKMLDGFLSREPVTKEGDTVAKKADNEVKAGTVQAFVDELMPLPVSPMPAINVFIAYTRKDETITTLELGHAALHLLCYGWGIVDPHTPVVKKVAQLVEEATTKHPEECNLDDCCKQIVNLTTAKGVAADEKGIDWVTVVALAFQIIQMFLNRKAN